MLLKLLYIEFKKTKKSFAFWLTIFGTIVIPLVIFLVMTIKPEKFIYPDVINPWKMLFNTTFMSVSSFLFPMYVIYLIGLLGNIEYKSSNWKKLFVLPVRKEMLISSKLLFVLLNVLFGIFLFGVYVLLFGFLAGAIRPETKLLDFAPDFNYFFWLIYHLFLSILGILALQFILSMFFENILVTLAIGLFLLVGALIAAGFDWDYIEYMPYAGPHLFAKNIQDIGSWLTKMELMNLIYFVLSFAFCLYFFKRKTVK